MDVGHRERAPGHGVSRVARRASERSWFTTAILVASRFLAWLALSTATALLFGAFFLGKTIAWAHHAPEGESDWGPTLAIVILCGSYILLSLGVILRDKD